MFISDWNIRIFSAIIPFNIHSTAVEFLIQNQAALNEDPRDLAALRETFKKLGYKSLNILVLNPRIRSK
jgi:hypothetical protein